MGSMISADDSGTVKQSCEFESLRSSLGCQDWRVSPTLWHVWKWKHFSAALFFFSFFVSLHFYLQGSYNINHLFPLIFVHWQDKPHLSVH